MGMAASQARFLGLTARKTNTEYEGQQVNQQRTALANQSAGLFNEMLALRLLQIILKQFLFSQTLQHPTLFHWIISSKILSEKTENRLIP